MCINKFPILNHDKSFHGNLYLTTSKDHPFLHKTRLIRKADGECETYKLESLTDHLF